MKKKMLLLLFGALAFCSWLSVGASTSLPQMFVRVIHQGHIEVLISEDEKARVLMLPAAFADGIDGLYEKVHVEDLNNDGVGEIVFQLGQATGVNICYRALTYVESSQSLKEMVFAEAGLCNFRFTHGHLVSAYRNAGAWTEDIYRFHGHAPQLLISDEGVGGGEVRRTVFSDNGSVIKYGVSDHVDYVKRIRLED
jgi:hypothetical protein